jgi:hypothetical protein
VCVRCQAPVNARVDEVAWVCATCGQGLLLQEDGGLVAQEIFFSVGLAQGGRGLPYWVAEGRAQLQRQTYKGNRSKEMQAFWQAPRRFFVPAYELPLQQVLEIGAYLLRQPPGLQAGSQAAFAPVVVPPSDVRPLAEFILLGIEAERKDALRSLQFELTLSEAQLWVLS